ncbi:MAG: calcium-binding protein [Pseudomonadota bacterium]
MSSFTGTRTPGIYESVDATGTEGLSGDRGNDTLEGSVEGAGQLHIFGNIGNDTLVLDLTNEAGRQGQHVYGGEGSDVFQFTNVHLVTSPVVGRINDFEPTRDTILIEDQTIDLNALPNEVELADGSTVSVRIVEHVSTGAENSAEALGLGPQQFLQIGDDIFFALEGAREGGREHHFVNVPDPSSLTEVDFQHQFDFVPHDHYDDLNLRIRTVTHGDDNFNGFETREYIRGHVQGSDEGHANGADEVIFANGGHDVVDAATGDDTVYGGVGHDSIAGGVDNDVLYGEAGNDMLWGGSANDMIDGGANSDNLYGGTGKDTLLGGQGNDRMLGGDGKDTVKGGDGEDRILGESGKDVLHGGAGNDVMAGNRNADLMFGDEGADRVIGGGGHDTVDGGYGQDKLFGGHGDDRMLGGDGKDTVKGGTGDDRILGESGKDVLYGGSGNDVMAGNRNADLMFGDNGDDRLIGGGGRDTLDGGAGDDLLVGGHQNDRFVFAEGHGNDTIADFEAQNSAEKIDFSNVSTIDSISDALNASSQVGDDVMIDTGGENSILLENVDIGDLDADDFIF